MSSARGARSEKVPDLNINGNASPDGDLSIPAEAEAYFTLDSNVSDTFIYEISLIFICCTSYTANILY